MKQIERGKLGGPWVWCTLFVVLSTLVGIWNAAGFAEKQPAYTTLAPAARAAQHDLNKPTTFQQIEATLAKAGCPGWMVLASEGEAALQRPTGLVPSDVKKTALRVEAKVPGVHLRAPLPVANRTLFGAPEASPSSPVM